MKSNISNGGRASPNDILPDDILAEIFDLVWQPAGDRHVVLSHVSRRWRDVIVNLGSLWTSIKVRPWQSLHKLETYLTRSKKQPLHIFFFMSTKIESLVEKDHCFKPSILMLLDHINRWEYLSVASSSYHIIREIVNHLRDYTASNLEHLEVSLTSASNYSVDQDILPKGGDIVTYIFTAGAPKLRYFKCSGLSIQFCWPPLGELSELWLEPSCGDDDGDDDSEPSGPNFPLSYDQFVDMMISFHRLESLRFSGVVFDTGGRRVPSIEIEDLSEIDIDCTSDPEYISIFLSCMSAPDLIKLVLCDLTEEITDELVNMLQSFKYQPRYPELTDLVFNNTAEISKEFCLVFPTVTHLGFLLCTDTIAVLQLLNAEPDNGVCWPKLKSIEFAPFEEDLFLEICDFFRTRKIMGYGLDRIVLREEDVGKWNRQKRIARASSNHDDPSRDIIVEISDDL